ncbi:monocarboxylate transporter 13-like [Saccoglossus kowalevskii]|uniref:Monocarboxylate transporter 12-like n=1 Tax=Saccoglossus kowalevskii TaxID=10224 RepID=A0ABM0GXL5_SACKO|nr:PREDICTED: monocarboxylate transporter 12-like [Saccoglossus kowalevskii]
MASQPNADGGLYAWIIVAGSHVVQAIYMGDIAGSSLFFVIFTEYFQEGGGRTFAIVSLQTCVPILIAPLVGVLTKRFGCRPLVIAGGLLSMVANLVTSFATSLKWMYFSYGIIQGFGLGLLYAPSIVIIGQHFTKRHALANGIVFAGVGVGMITFPPLYELLIRKYGWRGALIVISGIYLNVAVCGLLMRSPYPYRTQARKLTNNRRLSEEEVNNSVDDSALNDTGEHGVPTSEQRSVARYICSSLHNSPVIVLWRHNSWLRVVCAAGLLTGVGHYIALFHIVSKAVHEDILGFDAALLLTVFGVANMIGRVAHGWFIDLGYVSPMAVFAVTLILAGAFLLTMPLTNGIYAVFASVSAAYGLSLGIAGPLYAVSLKLCVGVHDLPTAIGWYVLCSGIGSMIGPPVAGWLYDVTSNYNISFIMGGVTTILAGCVVLVQLRYLRYKSKRLPSDCQYDPIAYSDGATEEHKAGVEKLAWMETTL